MKYISTRLYLFLFTVSVVFGQDVNSLDKQKLADEAFASGNYKEAEKGYLSIFQNINTISEEKGKTAYKIGETNKNLGELAKARDWYNTAADIFYELKLLDNQYIAKGKVANIFDDEGNYKAAIEIGEEIVAYFQKKNDSLYAAKTLHNLALFYYHDENTDKAIKTYSDAINWISNLDDNLKSKSLNMLGNIWAVILENEEKALFYYRQSLQLKLQNGTPQSISASYNNIGISHKNLGDYDSAIFYYEKAHEYAFKSKMPYSEINPLINIANLYKRLGEMDKAITYFNKALDLEKYMNARQQLDIRLNLGFAYNEWKDFTNALKQLKVAENFAIEAENLRDHITILSQIGVAQSGLNQFEKAYKAQLAYNNLKDSLNSIEKAQEIADQMVKYEAAQKDLQILEQKQDIQRQQLKSQKQSIWFLTIVTIVLFIAGILFYLFKRKAAIANQASLELSLAEQKELSRIQSERLRISRELHDNIGSYLTLMSASIEHLSLQNASNVIEDVEINNLQDTISMSMRELRKTVWLLNKQSVSLEEIGLRIRDFFKPLHQNGTQISVKIEGNTGQKLNEIQTTQLFRVIQETVSNAYKYAKCSNIVVKLFIGENQNLTFSILDDGEGFDIEQSNRGNGLQNIKSRITELNGEVQIETEIGKGTHIFGDIPLNNTNNYV
jgi:signal transduction histidine kinase